MTSCSEETSLKCACSWQENFGMNEWRNYENSTPDLILIYKQLEVASIMDEMGENLYCMIRPVDVDAK